MDNKGAEKPQKKDTQLIENNHIKEEQKTTGRMNNEEADAADAFAAVMGQAVAPPVPIVTKTYTVIGTKEALYGLEAFMRDNCITFNAQ